MPAIPTISPARSDLRKNLFLLASSLLGAVVLSELLVRLAGAAFHRGPIVISDPASGWANWPDLKDRDVTVAGGHYRLSTDKLGRRITYDSAPPVAAHSAAVLLVGDSFTYGYNVDDRATFAWLLARSMPDRRIINLGVPAWGTDQELVSLELAMRSREAQAVRDIIVLVFENDLRDVQRAFEPAVARSKPVFHASGTTLNRGEQFRLPLLDRLMDRVHLVWLIRTKTAGLSKPRRFDSAAGVDVVLACLGAMRRLGEAGGARVQVFAYRRPGASTVSDATWRGFVEAAGAVDLTGRIRTIGGKSPIGADGVHWNVEGHRQAAALIRESF